MRYLTLLLCLYAAPLAAAPRAALRLPEGLIISSITIETHNVYETELPAENKLIFRAANRIHYKTRDPVMLRELLFAAGARYNAALVAETERNLRALPFIRRAEAQAAVNKNGTVDIIIRTYDSWTLEVVANYKRAGGSTSVKAGLAEGNILGEGKAGSAVYSSDWGERSMSFDYHDLQFLRYNHLQHSMTVRTSQGSQNLSMSLDRPFYASIAPSSMGGSINYSAAPDGAGTRRTAEAGVRYGISIASSTERTRHINFGLLAHRAETTGPAPDRERSVAVQLGVDWEELDFLTARRIQKFTRDEDYNLGLGVFPVLEWVPPIRALGTTKMQITPGISVRKGFTWGGQLLLLKSSYSSKYVNGGNGNRIASFDAAYYLRGIRYQTLAIHTSLDIAWRLDPAEPLLLGEFRGLRGYAVGQFAGNRRVLLNVEDRVYVWDDLFRVMDVGLVFFFDSGYVWPVSKSVRLSDLKNSVGAGLRLAPSRSAGNNPVRIDLAHGLNGSQSPSNWLLSILGGQAF
jgi:outer membrane protein assembly factor BamA